MMLVLAELTKLAHQRGATFWGFVAMPLLVTLIASALAGIGAPGGGATEVRAVRSLLRALSVTGNPFAQLFYALGAAALFAVEYRHAGWRHLVPRRSRSALMLAKFAAFLIAGAASIALAAAGSLFASFVMPWLAGSAAKPVDWSAAAPAAILLSALLSLAELAVLGAIVALVTVITRSAMAAILIPFLLTLASIVAQIQFGWTDAPLPSFAAETLRAMLAAPFEGRQAPPANALAQAAVLTGWIGALLALTLAAFERQDLTSE